jgi:phosphopantothenoylcysteine decarboxylase/phosphopantothenate--cysteine ligase
MKTDEKRILLIIGGGVAAYKALDLIRVLSRRQIATRVILTSGGAEFITPLSTSALSGDKTYTDLFNLSDESEMGHIQLSRSADLIVAAPATANLIAKLAGGIADDLASTALLATDKPVMMAPAMNVRMWEHPATKRNLRRITEDGVMIVGPNIGDMACGEHGPGRMAEPVEIADAIEAWYRQSQAGILSGKKIVVTAGPTHEPLDPVRYIANRSSGKQGFAIADALLKLGADVTLVSGPANVLAPPGARLIRVETARQMMAAVEETLPVDAAVMCAAVADYRPEFETGQKIKKERGGLTAIPLAENPDILKSVANHGSKRPKLVVGFAAETDDVLSHARSKRIRKNCDWIVANDVSAGEHCAMGGDTNIVSIISETNEETWPEMTKTEVATRLASKIADALLK